MPRPSREDHAKKALARYYSQHGVMPTVTDFADAMGYASTSSAHHVLSKLVAQGYLSREERGGRLLPGPSFKRAAHPSLVDSGIPQGLIEALPKGVRLSVLQVDDHFAADDVIWPGDLLVLAPADRTDLSDVMVLRRGRAFNVRNESERGWTVHAVVVAQFRSFRK
jgi:SOS-response transcriptional repressor LexA